MNMDSRPYRPNVGVCLFNKYGNVWLGRTLSSGPEIVEPGKDWQFPQGGIEEYEDIVEAARRELFEETGAKTVKLLKATKEWWSYDFPVAFRDTSHKLTPFRGQKQKWVAFLFEGNDREFSITADHVDEPQEFLEWKWASLDEVLYQTIGFKQAQYQRVIASFQPICEQIKRAG